MITVNALQQFGADTAQGLGRCMNNEAFYLRLVNMGLDDASFSKLEEAVKNGDKKTAFEAAHALKGVLGNLSLTPLYTPVSEMTELLRAGKDADYSSMLAEIMKKRDALIALRND